MKKLIPALLLLTWLLGACSSSNSSTPSPSTSDGSTSVATDQSSSSREAVLSEIQNTVSAQVSADKQLAPASNGMSILSTGSVQTGDNSRVRLDLKPEGTIVRVGPNSSFSLPVMTDENGAPKTKLELLFGKVFIILKGGSLEVSTPSGVASVRGSLLSVQYDSQKGRVEADCLEGHCSLQNENGDEVDLSDGQTSYIQGDEDPPSDPEQMSREDVQDWMDENSDLQDYMDQVPNPEDYPEDSDTQDQNNEPPATEAPATDEPSSYIPLFGVANILIALNSR